MKTATGIAPGRLDVLGGVADYSGSLVLEMPLSLTTKVVLRERREPGCYFQSAELGACEVPAGTPAAALPAWVRYAYGCLLYFCRATAWEQRGGLEFVISSSVPVGMGVSSSAALEVATLRSLVKLSGRKLAGTALARLAQRVENEVVGAPCGLMDQLTSACGVEGALLPILCRPDLLEKPVKLPRGAIAVGWPSGVKHTVAGSPYATARAATFMGKKMIERATGRSVAHVTELNPSEIRGLTLRQLPEVVTGRDFLRRFGGVDDPLSKINPAQDYFVRAGVSFPVEENQRVRLAVALLRSARPAGRAALLAELGELLYQSHQGYASIGLGSPETDKMVAAVRELGPARGFYGARISAGGSGGTVTVLLEQNALPRLEVLMKRLKFRRDFQPLLLF